MSNRSPFSDSPITVQMGEYTTVVPHRNAAEWVDAVHIGHGPDSVAVLLSRETTREILYDALAVGDITREEMADASHNLISQAVDGYQWWKTARLLLLSATPGALGHTVVRGMDPWTLTVTQWCAGVYTIFTENADEKAKGRFDASLEARPPGVEDDGDWGADAFDAMVNAARSMPGMR